jgi:hypothetical protein
MVDHDPRSINYVVKYLAQMVQQPGVLIGIALVIVSSHQGAGKNIFLDLIAKIIG